MNSKKKFDYKWVIVVLSFMMVFTCLGFCSSNKSLYLDAITKALKIPRAAFSVNDSCRFIATAVINIFFGALVAKFGTKKLIAAGFLCLIGSCVIYATASNILVFYVGGVLLGLGLAWTTTTMVGWVVGKWCKENKGTIMGAILAANGLGGAVAVQIVSPLINEQGNPFGYRNAYLVSAAILFAVALIIMIFYKEAPKYADDAPAAKKKGRGQSWIGIEYKDALRKPYFYMALVCIFFTGTILQGIHGVAAAHMKDTGISPEFVATAMSTHLLVLAASKFLTGFIYDKKGLRTTVVICDISAIVVMFALAMMNGGAHGKILAVTYAVFAALALPLETVMIPIFANDLFGNKAYNKMLGLFVSVNTAGYALGTPVMNLVYDRFNTYTPMFIVCGVMMFGILITFQFIITAAHKVKKQTEE